jgi:hypothetical protein
MRSDEWLLRYINIPFKDHGRDFSGIDCYGLIRLMYKEERNITLPLHIEWTCVRHWPNLKINFSSSFDIRRLFRTENNIYFYMVDGNPKFFDVLVFYDSKMRVAEHLGLYLGKDKFIHIFDDCVVSISHFSDHKDMLFAILRCPDVESNI